jgi:hypothetical protein
MAMGSTPIPLYKYKKHQEETMKIEFLCERSYPMDIDKAKIKKAVEESADIIAPKNGENMILQTPGLLILLNKEKGKVQIVDYVFTDNIHTDKVITLIP